MIVAPTEPPKLRAAASKVSLYPESYGADILWRARGKWIGVQRKEVGDLVESVRDGRLGQQFAQMERLDVAVLLIEGELKWTMDGEPLTRGFGAGLSLAQYRGALWNAMGRGIWVDHSRDLDETIGFLTMMEKWSEKERHIGLSKRPGPVNLWGRPGNADYERHVLMGLPGVGLELADRIIAMYGMPFGWKITKDQLLAVDGIGKKKAETIWQGLGAMEVVT